MMYHQLVICILFNIFFSARSGDVLVHRDDYAHSSGYYDHHVLGYPEQAYDHGYGSGAVYGTHGIVSDDPGIVYGHPTVPVVPSVHGVQEVHGVHSQVVPQHIIPDSTGLVYNAPVNPGGLYNHAVNPGVVYGSPSGQPGIVYNSPANPGIVYGPVQVHPGAVYPGGANPGVVYPGGSNPGVVYPAPVNPGVVYPAAANPGVIYPATTNPGVVYPGAANPGVVYGPPSAVPVQPGTNRPDAPVSPPVIFIPDEEEDAELIPDYEEEEDNDDDVEEEEEEETEENPKRKPKRPQPTKPTKPKPSDDGKTNGRKLYPEAEYYNHLADIIHNKNASINITFSGTIVRDAPKDTKQQKLTPVPVPATKRYNVKPIKIVKEPPNPSNVQISILRNTSQDQVNYEYNSNSKNGNNRKVADYRRAPPSKESRQNKDRRSQQQVENINDESHSNDQSEVRISVIRRPAVRQPDTKSRLLDQSNDRQTDPPIVHINDPSNSQESRGHVNFHEIEIKETNRNDNHHHYDHDRHSTTEIPIIQSNDRKNDSVIVSANINFNRNRPNYINFTDIVYAKNGNNVHETKANVSDISPVLLPPLASDENTIGHRTSDGHAAENIFHASYPDRYYPDGPKNWYIPPDHTNHKHDRFNHKLTHDETKNEQTTDDKRSEITVKVSHTPNVNYVTPVPQDYAHLRAAPPAH